MKHIPFIKKLKPELQGVNLKKQIFLPPGNIGGKIRVNTVYCILYTSEFIINLGMTLPSSPPKEKVVVQNPPANQPPEKNQMIFAFGQVIESEQAAEEQAAGEQVAEEQAAEEQAAEQAAEEQAAEQNKEAQTDEVDVSPPPSVSVDEMMKNSTPSNSQTESRHTPSLSPIIEHVSCHM